MTEHKGRMIIVEQLDDGKVRMEVKTNLTSDDSTSPVFSTESVELYPEELVQEGIMFIAIATGLNPSILERKIEEIIGSLPVSQSEGEWNIEEAVE